MNRDEIYDHLAQVYLGKTKKSEEKKQLKQKHSWLVINILITFVVFLSVCYGLTAFLSQKSTSLKSNILFSLHRGPSKLEYNFYSPSVDTKAFAVTVPDIEVDKYTKLQFSVRAQEEGSPGIVKVVLKNARAEESVQYIKNIDFAWQEYRIDFDDFYEITDWSCLEEVSFIVESWNVDDKTGVIMIENINFST